MADLSNGNSSFIPKRGPVKRKRNANTRRVYVFTLVSYVVMFATLLGTGAVYLYSGYNENLLNREIALLDSEIANFNEPDVLRVQEFNARLEQASGRLYKSVSLVSLFEALEVSTIETVKIDSLSLKRDTDSVFVLDAQVETDSFDSTIFQRGEYSDFEVIEDVFFDAVETPEVGSPENQEATPVVRFRAEIEIPFTQIPFVPYDEADLNLEPPAISPSTTDQDEESNNETSV